MSLRKTTRPEHPASFSERLEDTATFPPKIFKFSHFTFYDTLLFSPFFIFPNILGYVKSSRLLLHKIEIEQRPQLKLFKNNSQNNCCVHWIITRNPRRTKLETLQYTSGFPKPELWISIADNDQPFNLPVKMCRTIKTKALALKRNLITISQMTKGNPHVERFTCIAYCSRTGISFPHSSHCFAVSTGNEGSLEPILTCFTAPEREPSEFVLCWSQ